MGRHGGRSLGKVGNTQPAEVKRKLTNLQTSSAAGQRKSFARANVVPLQLKGRTSPYQTSVPVAYDVTSCRIKRLRFVTWPRPVAQAGDDLGNMFRFRSAPTTSRRLSRSVRVNQGESRWQTSTELQETFSSQPHSVLSDLTGVTREGYVRWSSQRPFAHSKVRSRQRFKLDISEFRADDLGSGSAASQSVNRFTSKSESP